MAESNNRVEGAADKLRELGVLASKLNAHTTGASQRTGIQGGNPNSFHAPKVETSTSVSNDTSEHASSTTPRPGGSKG